MCVCVLTCVFYLVLSTDSILVKVPPVVGMAAMSELHGAECLKLISRLSSVHVNLELGAQQVQLRGMQRICPLEGCTFCLLILYHSPRPCSIIRCVT